MTDITLNHITKIEGHAKLRLGIEKGKVEVCELSSVEGSRYFEGLVKGRRYDAAHEMTSRICGICSCAHVIAALSAVEDALGMKVSSQTFRLRELLMLGERIRSHATHLYFLALPDYLGFESALAMAPEHKKELKHALAMMKVGNGIVKLLGARDIHPVSATVGGWLALPTNDELAKTAQALREALPDAQRTVELFAHLPTPDFATEGEWFAVKHPKEYGFLRGKFTNGEQTYEKKDYRTFISEYHEDYSTANFVVREGKRYTVGALARLNHNARHLRPKAAEALKKAALALPSANPWHNNLAQAVELVHCMEHAIAICSSIKVKAERPKKVRPRKGRGVGMVEVPRGTLWHEYSLDKEGVITDANIVTPTAQNLLNMQEDIRVFVPSVLSKPKERIVIEVEKLIRSYDPCFSCSAHFLEVDWV